MTERPEPPYALTLKIAKWGAIGLCLLTTAWLGLNLPTDLSQFLQHVPNASALEAAGAMAYQNILQIGTIIGGFAAYKSADKAETIVKGMRNEQYEMRAAAKAQQPYIPEFHALHDREQQVSRTNNFFSTLFGGAMMGYGALSVLTMAPLMAAATPYLLTFVGLGLATIGAAVLHTSNFAGKARQYSNSAEGEFERNHIIDVQYHHHLSQVENHAHSLLNEINTQRQQYQNNPMPANHWQMTEMQRRMQAAQSHISNANNSIRMP